MRQGYNHGKVLPVASGHASSAARTVLPVRPERKDTAVVHAGRWQAILFQNSLKIHRIGDGPLPTVGIDMLYDYFISGAGTVHGSSSSITRLREIETIIRDVRDLGETETTVLKTVGVLNLVGHSGRTEGI